MEVLAADVVVDANNAALDESVAALRRIRVNVSASNTTPRIAVPRRRRSLTLRSLGCPGGRAIRQHIDNLAPLQVDDDGPGSATLSPTPVIDARHSYSRLRMETGDPPFQMPQNGIVTDRHAETFHQPFGRPTTSAVAEKMNKFCGPLGPTSARHKHSGS